MYKLLLAIFLAGCGAAPSVSVTVAPPENRENVGVSVGLKHTLHMLEGCTAVDAGYGFILTAKHCVDELSVGSITSVGTLVFVSANRDFAILFDVKSANHQKPKMRACNIGEHLYAIGWPVQMVNDKMALTVTDGLCAGPVDESDGELRITAPIYFGNSGGGVWGDDGALLGLSVKGILGMPAMNYMVSVSDIEPFLPGD